MSDTPLTVAPAIQHLALALAALEAGVVVGGNIDPLSKPYLAMPPSGTRYYYGDTPIDALASSSVTPHPAIMSLVSALQQARERLAELDGEVEVVANQYPLETHYVDFTGLITIIDAALKGE